MQNYATGMQKPIGAFYYRTYTNLLIFFKYIYNNPLDLVMLSSDFQKAINFVGT